MRKLLSVLVLALAAAACEGSPTASPVEGATAPRGPSRNCIIQPGQQSIRTLASKRIVMGWELYGCYGPGLYETYYEFRSTDQWICYADMPTYYAYYPYDDAECGWYAG